MPDDKETRKLVVTMEGKEETGGWLRCQNYQIQTKNKNYQKEKEHGIERTIGKTTKIIEHTMAKDNKKLCARIK